MTDTQLLALFHARKAAWEALGQVSGRGGLDESRRFREADAAIVAELVRRGAPAKLDGVTLHLTYDRRNFVALRPGTTTPLVWCPGTGQRAGEELKRIQNVLLDYRKAALKRRAGAAV